MNPDYLATHSTLYPLPHTDRSFSLLVAEAPLSDSKLIMLPSILNPALEYMSPPPPPPPSKGLPVISIYVVCLHVCVCTQIAQFMN